MIAHPQSPPAAVSRILLKAQPGMQVYDILGQRIGQVEYARPGEANYGSKIEWTKIKKRPDKFDYAPDPAEIRLICMGYIKINRGSSAQHAYAYADQLAAVSAEGVFLKVTVEQLFYTH